MGVDVGGRAEVAVPQPLLNLLQDVYKRQPYAISVLVENGGSGGSVAAPVARQVFEYLRDNLPSKGAYE